MKLRAIYYPYPIDVQVLGPDAQGRPQYICPAMGCGDTGYFDALGTGHCPSCETAQAGFDRLVSGMVERLGMGCAASE